MKYDLVAVILWGMIFMVTKGRYEKYKERKTRPIGDDKDIQEEEMHVILDEIAEMRGYKEKLIGKMKVRPIVQYADYLIGQKYGFKPIKKGEKYFDRKSGEPVIAIKRISPMQQYINMLGEQKVSGFVSMRRYNEWLAKKEGFESFRDKEEQKSIELGLSSIEEYHDFLARGMGFDSYEEYIDYISDIYEIRGRYASLIPEKDFIDVFKMLKTRWMAGHEKFISFCEEFWNDSLKPFFDKDPKKEASVLMEDIDRELEKYHQSRPGSLHIYGTDDKVIGLSNCLEDKYVDVILSKNKKNVTFRKRESVV